MQDMASAPSAAGLKGETKILHLTLEKRWFDLIESGKKDFEYREIKPYWINRLQGGKAYSAVRFRNGYRPDARTMTRALKGVELGIGDPSLGAPQDRPVFILHLGAKIAQP